MNLDTRGFGLNSNVNKLSGYAINAIFMFTEWEDVKSQLGEAINV